MPNALILGRGATPKLLFRNNKLVQADFLTYDPALCCCKLAIIIYNSNGAKDDNFEVFLNDVSIGTIDNNVHDCTGRIFVDGLIVEGDALVASGIIVFSCGAAAFEPTLQLDMGIVNLRPTPNFLKIVVTQNNGNGNFGNILVCSLRYNGTTGLYSAVETHLNTVYSQSSVPPGTVITNDSFLYPAAP